MEKINNCPICDNKAFENHLTAKDHFLSQETFTIVRCTECNFLFTNPRPTVDQSGQYYQSTEYISHSNTNKGLINKIYRQVRNISLKQKTKLIQKYFKSGNVLDIGCGTGHFLNALKNTGFDVKGIEPGENARTTAREYFNLDVNSELDDLDSSQNKFQVITMWHVLEHIYPLNNYLEKITNLLMDNGILVIAVPNPESYDAEYYGEFWGAYDLPRHIYHFTGSTISKLLNTHNFKLIKTLPMNFDSYYVSMLSEKYKRGKNNFVSACLTGLRSNLKAKSNNNNFSSRIYIFKSKIS